jgi:hypothetical protein
MLYILQEIKLSRFFVIARFNSNWNSNFNCARLRLILNLLTWLHPLVAFIWLHSLGCSHLVEVIELHSFGFITCLIHLVAFTWLHSLACIHLHAFNGFHPICYIHVFAFIWLHLLLCIHLVVFTCLHSLCCIYLVN